jgi:hypothetical protein
MIEMVRGLTRQEIDNTVCSVTCQLSFSEVIGYAGWPSEPHEREQQRQGRWGSWHRGGLREALRRDTQR